MITGQANLAYYFFPGLSLGAEYRLRYNLSDLELAKYVRHLVTLNLTYEY